VTLAGIDAVRFPGECEANGIQLLCSRPFVLEWIVRAQSKEPRITAKIIDSLPGVEQTNVNERELQSDQIDRASRKRLEKRNGNEMQNDEIGQQWSSEW
jgi:hypothetical protein